MTRASVGPGTDRLQAGMVQRAWSWGHGQPQSALTIWSRTRVGQRKRARTIGIVALARKLLIALWRWATDGVVPAGAIVTGAYERLGEEGSRALRVRSVEGAR